MLAKQAYEEISEISIGRMFIRCGLLGLEEPRQKIVELMFEGLFTLNKNNGYLRQCLLNS